MSNTKELSSRSELGLDFMDQIHKKFGKPSECKGWIIARGQDNLIRAYKRFEKISPQQMNVIFTPSEQTDNHFATIINKVYRNDHLKREIKSISFLEMTGGNEPIFEHFRYDNDIERGWKRRRIYRGLDAAQELTDQLTIMWRT